MGIQRFVQSVSRFLDLRYVHLYVINALRPVVAFLPAPLAYWIARQRGDWRYWLDTKARESVILALKEVLGDQLSPAERQQVARNYFRLRACEAVDMVRLSGSGRALARLVEIRGLEHIEAALAAGKGAIICSAHYGSFDSAFSLLGVHGFPITVIGRWPNKFRRSVDQFFFQRLVRQPVERHRHRPGIQPRGQVDSGFQAAKILRKNELIGVCLDAPVLAADRKRAVQADFLNGKVLLLPGTITIAQLGGVPVLMTFMRRTKDWRHQIMEISPPVSLDGDTMMAFKRCLAVVEAAVRADPAYWYFWYGLADLERLGLLTEQALKAYDAFVDKTDWGQNEDDLPLQSTPDPSLRSTK